MERYAHGRTLCLGAVLTAALVFVPFTGMAQIAAWEFNTLLGTEVTVAATTLNPNLNATSVSRGAGITPSALGNAFSATGYNAAGTQAQAITSGDYMQFTIGAQAGFQVSLSTLNANFRRSGTGPNTFLWQYSFDGFATAGVDIGTSISYTLTTTNGDAQTPITLTGISALQNVVSGTTITMRLYGWGASATGGTFALGRLTGNDLAIAGTVSPAGGCGITLGTPTTSCNALTPGTDTYNLSIPYTGLDAGTSVQNNGASGAVGGSNPALITNGTIVINNINEGDAYNVTFTGTCSALPAVSGASPSCVPPPCGIALGTVTATCNTITVGTSDTYNLSIAYTGSQPGVTVINNSGSGTIGGSDPATTANGTIVISGISEVNNYSVTFSAPCAALTASGSAPLCEPPPALVINEIDYDMVGTDNAEWLELYNFGATPINLTGFIVELFNGANNTVYKTIVIPSGTVAAGDYFVIGNSALIPNVDL
ncbi:MAG TPA: lamin tail domain-containing protein, partial [Flavobacteriales bacterium]|nr:lamin tail domain-containing protein [Flavobacteriales bacterium]